MSKKIAKLLIGFLILAAIQIASNFILKFFHAPFPSPLLGMIILTFLLQYKVIPESLIKDISNLLLKNMALFFIPLLVGVMTYFHLIYKNLVPLIFTIIFTTFFTMVLTAIFVETIIKHIRRMKIAAISENKSEAEND